VKDFLTFGDVKALKVQEGFDLLRKVDLPRLQRAKKRELELMKHHWYDEAKASADRLAKSLSDENSPSSALQSEKQPESKVAVVQAERKADAAEESDSEADESTKVARKLGADGNAADEADEELFSLGPQGLIDTILMPERSDKKTQTYVRMRTVLDENNDSLPRLVKPECAC